MAVTSSSSPPLPPHCASSIFQFDKPYSSASFEATADRQTPPPLPPKPSHFSEQLNNEGAHRLQAMSANQPSGHTLLIPSGISLSGLDRLGIGNLCPPMYILCSFVFRLLLQYHKLFCAGKSAEVAFELLWHQVNYDGMTKLRWLFNNTFFVFRRCWDRLSEEQEAQP